MEPTPITPSQSIGPFHLGASLHEILTTLKEASRQTNPPTSIELHHSPTNPLSTPLILHLPTSSLRLRFDGPDQRLRLIEVTNYHSIRLRYKGSDLIKVRDDAAPVASGPNFKRVYELFGPSYPGEYFPPPPGSQTGTYVSSWPGVAFNFPLQHAAWSKEKDHVALLGSHAAGVATSMAVFEGKSWAEARQDLFVRMPTGPRCSALASRPKDCLPLEIEHAHVLGNGKIELFRQSGEGNITIVLNETTVQDLTTELGPPEATHRPDHGEASMTERHGQDRRGSATRPTSNGRGHTMSQPSSYSSTGTDTFETDFEPTDQEEDAFDRANRQKYWCYFTHGMDILVGPPADLPSTTITSTTTPRHGISRTPLSTSPHLVVLKVTIHGNIPGSYAFNRHRRLRWTISLPQPSPQPHHPDPNEVLETSTTYLTSEQSFESEILPHLLSIYSHTSSNSDLNSELGKGKVVNRTWSGGRTSGESSFFLPDAEQELEGDERGIGFGGGGGGGGGDGGSGQWLGNTRLYAFPGLGFEVLENGAVAALSVG
ncbi:hypothetical protein LTR62_005452 [Meristemomyces frigidus]|uniref:Uncharacterized protein n=1 Tax=Meristemomyces frigidus TaxID=1508187 RepID=A0AAN7YNH5_9PEZI|nr:hypothetical protein LTR62_005452 [Meristemomyces frigidus]